MEDKQNICDLLCKTLKATRNHEDLEALTYIYELGIEPVVAKWSGGGHKEIQNNNANGPQKHFGFSVL